MPWTRLPPTTGKAIAIGYRGGFFHPGTGYSLGRAAIVANRIAGLAKDVNESALQDAVEKNLSQLRNSFAADDRFARLLNKLAFRHIPSGWLRDAVFSPVYQLPQAVLARFYAGRTSLRDRLAIAAAPARIPFFRQTANQPALLGESP
jgi:lycopene beta-cyclase